MGKAIKTVGRILGGGGGKQVGVPGAGNVRDIDKEAFTEGISGQFQSDINQRQERTQGDLNVARGNEQQTRGEQSSLAAALRNQANAEAPSVASQEFRRATDRNLAQQLAMASSTRGGNAALTARNLMRNQAQTTQEAAGDAAKIRADEQVRDQQRQLQTQQLLDQVLSGSRGQDLASAQQLAGVDLALLGQDIGLAQTDQQSKQLLEQLQLQRDLGLTNAQMQAQTANQSAQTQRDGALMGAIGGGLGAFLSDKKLKKDIKSGSKSTQEFLNALKAKTFKFKDKKDGEGEHLGIMAQDVEKAGDIGKAMIIDTPEGKAIDMKKGFGAILAAQSELNERLKKIEEKRSKSNAS